MKNKLKHMRKRVVETTEFLDWEQEEEFIGSKVTHDNTKDPALGRFSMRPDPGPTKIN